MPYVLNGVKWGNPTKGTAATVNWSFADNPALDTQLAQTYPGYTDFDATISGSFRDIVRSVFSLWDLLTGITFVEVADSAASQLRVGQDFIDGAGNAAGQATWHTNGAGSITQATIEFEAEAFNDTNLFYLLGLHEVGHAIGLGHSSSSFDIMFPTVGSQTGLSIDDLTGGRFLYSSGLTLQGTTGGDAQNGGSADDIIFGFEGGDTVNGNGGDDIIVGGRDSSDAADSLLGGAGNDVTYGNGGADSLVDTSGNNIMIGGFGNDSIVTGAGNDIVYGNQNNDTVNAGDGANLVFGGQGNDSILGGTGRDTFQGNEGNDTIRGGLDIDTITGGSGNDLFAYGAANEDGNNANAGGPVERITDVNWAEDRFDTTPNITFAANIGPRAAANLNAAANDAINAATTLNGGVNTVAAQFTFGGSTYVAINLAANGFQDANDLLLDITGFTGTIVSSNFI